MFSCLNKTKIAFKARLCVFQQSVGEKKKKRKGKRGKKQAKQMIFDSHSRSFHSRPKVKIYNSAITSQPWEQRSFLKCW